jgi:hypothetical protein
MCTLHCRHTPHKHVHPPLHHASHSVHVHSPLPPHPTQARALSTAPRLTQCPCALSTAPRLTQCPCALSTVHPYALFFSLTIAALCTRCCRYSGCIACLNHAWAGSGSAIYASFDGVLSSPPQPAWFGDVGGTFTRWDPPLDSGEMRRWLECASAEDGTLEGIPSQTEQLLTTHDLTTTYMLILTRQQQQHLTW